MTDERREELVQLVLETYGKGVDAGIQLTARAFVRTRDGLIAEGASETDATLAAAASLAKIITGELTLGGVGDAAIAAVLEDYKRSRGSG